MTGPSSHDGQTQQAIITDPFGELITTIGSTATPAPAHVSSKSELVYMGRDRDFDAHLYYFRARHYDPFVGEFVSEDPFGFSAGTNFYTFVGNNPVKATDPSGKCPMCIGAGTSVLLGGLIRGAVGYYQGRWDQAISSALYPQAIAVDAALGAVGACYSGSFPEARQ